jgi:hypothetical protein
MLSIKAIQIFKNIFHAHLTDDDSNSVLELDVKIQSALLSIKNNFLAPD